MALSVFDDKLKKPEARALARALGAMRGLWDDLKRRIAARHGPLDEEWVFSGRNYGWSLRLKRKKRAVLYMTPCEGYFRVGLALGENAVRAAQQADLPAAAVDLIAAAPKYPEGRGIRMEVRSEADIALAESLAAVKMAN